MLILDHLAVVCSDLKRGVAWVEERLGVAMQAGGRHDRFGTHNLLLGLADGLYLEVIAPDPGATMHGPRWFGLDSAPSQPRLGNWICQADDLGAHTAVAGPAISLTRANLHWDITVPDDGSLPYGGAFPTLIKWGAGVTHPATTLASSGLCLTQLQVSTPDAAKVKQAAGAIDPRVVIVNGNAVALSATFDGPNGRVTL